MEQKTTGPAAPSRPRWARVEAFVREQVQQFLQALWAEEVPAWRGRPKSARRAAVDAPGGRRKGHGTPRRGRRTTGPITVRRPRVRGRADRVVRRGRPLCQRRAREGGEQLPTLYVQGWARGDCDLALRGLLGEAAPLSPAS